MRRPPRFLPGKTWPMCAGASKGLAKKMEQEDGRPIMVPTFNAKSGATAVGARMPWLPLMSTWVTIWRLPTALPAMSAMPAAPRPSRQWVSNWRSGNRPGLHEHGELQELLCRVVELIRAEARRYGVNIVGSEIIGECPWRQWWTAWTITWGWRVSDEADPGNPAVDR